MGYLGDIQPVLNIQVPTLTTTTTSSGSSSENRALSLLNEPIPNYGLTEPSLIATPLPPLSSKLTDFLKSIGTGGAQGPAPEQIQVKPAATTPAPAPVQTQKAVVQAQPPEGSGDTGAPAISTTPASDSYQIKIGGKTISIKKTYVRYGLYGLASLIVIGGIVHFSHHN